MSKVYMANKAKNTLKMLSEGVMPRENLENQVLTLESLKTLVAQAREIQTLLIDGHLPLQTLLEQSQETRTRIQELDAQILQLTSVVDAIAAKKGANEYIWNDTNGKQNDPEERILEFLSPRLEDKTFLDVGANRGEFTAEMLGIGFTSIHAFEPHPELAKALEAEYQDDSRVTVHPLAISDVSGPSSLHLVGKPPGEPAGEDLLLYSSLSPHQMHSGMEFQSKLPVECRSLADLEASGAIPAKASVLKIDTEGCDLSVIKGMPGGTPYEIILSEFWSDDFVFASPGEPSHKAVLEHMRSNGYPHSISIIHKPDESLCFSANMFPRTKQVWGNTFYFRDLELFEAAYSFVRNTLPQVV